MNLPRVIIDVTPRGDEPGWRVTITGDGALMDEFVLDAVTVDAGGRELIVPWRDGPDLGELGELLARIDDRDTRDGDIYTYGGWLFGCLLESVWPKIRDLPTVVDAKGVELALRWPVDQAPLHQLSWEAMCHEGRPLANHLELLVAITRLVPVWTRRVETIERTPKVLFAVGGSLLDDTIRPGAMFMGLLRAFDAEGVCAARAEQQVSSDKLARYCREFAPDVVHLVAHGDIVDGHGRLKLADGWIGADALVPALTTAASPPLAVVLSACRTGSTGVAEPMPSGPLAAELVANGIPIVSAIAGEVSEQACRLYSRRLVAAVSDGTPLAKAVADGRRAALSRTEPGRELDWAMPALFVADSVEPDFRPVNRDAAEWLVKAAREMHLRQYPVFIGREAVLGYVDDMFDQKKPVGVIGVLRDGSLADLGGTRLLQEMGYQLLMRGHLPLLLGPYSDSGRPKNLRAFLYEVFDAVTIVAEPLGLTPPRFEVLDKCYPTGVAAGPRDCLRALISALDEFGPADGQLPVRLTVNSLAKDLGDLAEAAGKLGRPFGAHTRVVLLADEIHRWPFVEELGEVLKRAGEKGLGTGTHHAPFVFTASSQEDGGRLLKSLSDLKNGQPGYAFPPFDELGDNESLLGFQWILLNPWLETDEACRKVYAALPTANWDQVRAAFGLMDGRPGRMRNPVFLYRIADVLVKGHSFVADDDVTAWTSYQGLA